MSAGARAALLGRVAAAPAPRLQKLRAPPPRPRAPYFLAERWRRRCSLLPASHESRKSSAPPARVVGSRMRPWVRARARPQRPPSSTPRSLVRVRSRVGGSAGRRARRQRQRTQPPNAHPAPTPARPPRRRAPPGRAPGRSSWARWPCRGLCRRLVGAWRLRSSARILWQRACCLACGAPLLRSGEG